MFLLSDELGSIKSISQFSPTAESSKKPENEYPKILLDGPGSGKTNPVQKLAVDTGLVSRSRFK
jgi:hypothetical protein